VTEFWATLIGAAAGVVAGALIQYIVQFFIGRLEQRRQRQALKKEMEYNLQVVADLIVECTNLRNAVNGNALNMYFGYLQYERGIFAQSIALLNNGLLYRWFTIEALKKLQRITSILNVAHANVINSSIKERRDAAAAGTLSQAQATQFVNFIERELTEIRQLLNEFIALI
jgi:hypothetical protein